MKNFLFLIATMAVILLLSISVSQSALTNITTINIGASANDHTGDTLRAAMAKVNTNTLILSNAVATLTVTGITTNYTVPGGATFYITNGVIMNVQ